MDKSTYRCPYDYIAIEGVIGIGKTSLARLLSEKLGGRSILEDFESNPFIADFYRDPRSFAFKTQLFFLVSRFKRYLDLPLPDLFDSPLVVDFIFQKDKIFASVNLDDDELELYSMIWNVLEPKVRTPDLIVYLQASTATLLSRIRKRGRPYEKNMSPEYLDALNNAYNEFFFHYAAAPVLIVNTDDIDFVESPQHLDDLIREIVRQRSGIAFYHPGGM